MFKKIKSILFAVSVVMVFTAQTNRPDDNKQQHAASRPQIQTQRVAPKQLQARRQEPQPVHRTQPVVQAHQPARQVSQLARQQWQGPRVYAQPEQVPVANNRFLDRQHHNHWQPRYNFYDNQYHFYPYVNIASLVELTADGVSVIFDGQNYFYDQGTFYLQDPNGQYMAVAPPVGIIVNAIPPQAHQIEVDGQIYYRCKGIFYVQVAQGFQVISPVAPDPN